MEKQRDVGMAEAYCGGMKCSHEMERYRLVAFGYDMTIYYSFIVVSYLKDVSNFVPV